MSAFRRRCSEDLDENLVLGYKSPVGRYGYKKLALFGLNRGLAREEATLRTGQNRCHKVEIRLMLISHIDWSRRRDARYTGLGLVRRFHLRLFLAAGMRRAFIFCGPKFRTCIADRCSRQSNRKGKHHRQQASKAMF